MKLQRSSLILLGVALLLGGAVYLLEITTPSLPEATAPQDLFAFEESDVQQLAISHSGKQVSRLSFTKSSSAGSGWQLITPTTRPASAAAVAYLLNLMATGSAKETLTVPTTQLAEFGLEPPIATVEVKLANQQTHRLHLGKPNFNRSGLYARHPDRAEVLLVAIDFANAVDRPFTEWLAPPPAQPAAPKPR